jgi:hypothetical protein
MEEPIPEPKQMTSKNRASSVKERRGNEMSEQEPEED